MKNVQLVLYTVAAFLICLLVGLELIGAWEKQEIVDCKSWEKQAAELSGFFLTEWQDTQCRNHGIAIDTTVIKN